MASINTITITGRAGRDPEVRYFDGGSAVASLRVAVDRFGNDKTTGERKKPVWIDVKVWGKHAQVAADYVRKGSMVGITGRLDEETWTDRQSGDERSKLVINSNDLILLGDARGGDGQQGAPQRTAAPARQQTQAWNGNGGSDEEIPF
jgi:single-strand DNA-binding protein